MLVRFVVVFALAAVITAMIAGTAMAQTNDAKAAREAQREANRAAIAQKAAEAGVDTPEEAAAYTGIDTPEEAEQAKAADPPDKAGKALPKTGGSSIPSLFGLGAGVLLVGGGLLAYRRSARNY